MKVVCTASQHQEIHFDRRQLAAVAIGSLLLPASSAQVMHCTRFSVPWKVPLASFDVHANAAGEES